MAHLVNVVIVHPAKPTTLQVTIPFQIWKKLNIKAGDRLAVKLNKNQIIYQKIKLPFKEKV